MKRIVTWIVLACMLVTLLPVSAAYASQTEEIEDVIYFENGDYIVVTLESVSARTSGTKTVSKTHTYRNSDGDALWAGKLTATFAYTGTSATCTAASCSVTIYDSAWYSVSKTASKSGNTATANINMACKRLGVVVSRENCIIKLTCDRNGNIS